MPYKTIEDLPGSVRRVLPKSAQRIFMKVFNTAYAQYDKEDTVFKVAWSAVKKEYKKNAEGKWKKRSGKRQ